MATKNGKSIGCLIGLMLGATVLAGGAITGINVLSFRNTCIDLEQSIKQQHQANQSNYDSMIKSAKEMVQVTDMYAEDFEKIYSDLIAGRNQDTGLLFKVVQESNPNLDSTVYTTLQRELSANRKTFDNNQQKLLDRVREYNSFVQKKFISSAILNKKAIDSSKLIVTSTSTQDAFNSGVADEINLRGDK